MKKHLNLNKTLIFLFFLALFFHSSYAQSDLYGKWKALCVIERMDDGNMTVCNICPTKQISGSTLIEDFEMEINAEVIKFKTEVRGTESSYKWDATKNTLSFTYNKTDYKFKVLIQTDPYINILKDINGSLLFLKKLP